MTPPEERAAPPPPPPPPPPPAPPPLDPWEALARACDVEFFTAGGPGGQHRNKTASGVRLRHRPSGIVVEATERRSQPQNRAVALERLKAKLDARARPKKRRRKTRPTRASKERRLESKRRTARKKAERRGGD
jgi:protein subunit release factor B